MKIQPKIILTLLITLALGSAIQGVYRFIVDMNQYNLELRALADNTMQRLQNALAQPVWNFDQEMVFTVVRLELNDPNIAAIEVEDNLGGSLLFLGRQRGSHQVQNLLLTDRSLQDWVRKNAFLTLRENLTFQGNILGSVTLLITDEQVNRKLYNQAFSLALQSILVLVVLLLVTSYALRKIIVRPIVELTRVVVDIFKSGDLSVRSPIKSKDEIGVLSRQYNKMLDIIQEYTDKLELKVKERTRELAEANAILTRQKAEIDRNLAMAQKIQLNLIPNERTYPVRDELKFHGLYSAMDAIGGDIFDVIRCGRNAYGILMADVSGHGIPAALVTAMAKVSFNTHASAYGIKTSEVCSRVNKDITRLLGNDFSHYLTAFFGIIDLEKKTFFWTNCGHHPALLIRQGTVLSLGSPGPFIGFIENASFTDESIELQQGDRIVLYTDGIVEAKSPSGELYDVPRLIAMCRQYAGRPNKEFIEAVLNDLKSFCGEAKADDDRAVLVVDYLRDDTVKELDLQAGKVFKSEKKEIKVHLQEAVLLARQGRYTEALNLLENLYAAHREHPKVAINLSLVLYKLGEHERALRILQKAYQECSKNEEIKEFLKRLQERINETASRTRGLELDTDLTEV